jgi:hypothetical protein
MQFYFRGVTFFSKMQLMKMDSKASGHSTEANL